MEGIVKRAEIEDTDNFSANSPSKLHETCKESHDRTEEIKGMVGHILHHDQPLSNVTFDNQVHQSCADEPSDQASERAGNNDRKFALEHVACNEGDLQTLNCENEGS